MGLTARVRRRRLAHIVALGSLAAVFLAVTPSAQAAPTAPSDQVIKIRIDRQDGVVALPVSGVSVKDRIFVNWGDGSPTRPASRVNCTSKRARIAPTRCAVVLEHEYDEPGTYQVNVNVGSRRLASAQVTILPIARPWTPPDGWQQPAGWSILNGGATYLPCSTVQWFWDAAGQPGGTAQMLPTTRQALDRISRATGLTFVETANPAEATLTFDWKFDNSYPGAAGYGGGSSHTGTGKVTLNPNHWWVVDTWAGFGPKTADYVFPDGAVGWQTADGNGDLILHEVGHALGLGHVDDPLQTMHPNSSTGRDGFGPGDLAGLSQMYLGQPCPAPESL